MKTIDEVKEYLALEITKRETGKRGTAVEYAYYTALCSVLLFINRPGKGDGHDKP